MITLNQLYQALNTLSKNCENQECKKCPFYVGDKRVETVCFFQLQELPCDWEPKETPADYFRFF